MRTLTSSVDGSDAKIIRDACTDSRGSPLCCTTGASFSSCNGDTILVDLIVDNWRPVVFQGFEPRDSDLASVSRGLCNLARGSWHLGRNEASDGRESTISNFVPRKHFELISDAWDYSNLNRGLWACDYASCRRVSR